MTAERTDYADQTHALNISSDLSLVYAVLQSWPPEHGPGRNYAKTAACHGRI